MTKKERITENEPTDKKGKVTLALRLISMLSDHFAMTFISTLIVLPFFAVVIFSKTDAAGGESTLRFGLMLFSFVLAFSAYFNKDIFNGQSPAKRVLKMQVMDNKTGKVADPLKCLVRNLTIPIWPLEVIFVLINPKRRLGDKIAGTRIDYVENPLKTKVNRARLITTFLITLGFSALIATIYILLHQNGY